MITPGAGNAGLGSVVRCAHRSDAQLPCVGDWCTVRRACPVARCSPPLRFPSGWTAAGLRILAPAPAVPA